MTEEYNGWPNKATWNVALWLNDSWPVPAFSSPENAKDYVEYLINSQHNNILNNAGVAVDLLAHALGGVDWQCIYAHFREEEDEAK